MPIKQLTQWTKWRQELANNKYRMRVSDLDKLVNFHSKLNPELWVNGRLRPEVRLHLFQIAKAFVQFIDVKDLKLTDITISGSNASYNYNDVSDIDLHLIADVNGPCEENLHELFLAKKSMFNDQHDISILGHAVEVYVQNSDEPHVSNGIYSVYHDRWIKHPEKITANPDTTNIEHKYEYLKAEIDQAIDSGDPATMIRLKQRIKKIRQAGLEASGEYGVENLAFKLLRNAGDIGRLWKASQTASDQELSLNNIGDVK